MILHIAQHGWVCTVHDLDTLRCDLTIDGSEATEDDVDEHQQSILSDPVLRRVKVSRFERIEDGLDAIEVYIAMLTLDRVESSLQCGRVGLFSVVLDLSFTRVTSEMTHE